MIPGGWCLILRPIHPPRRIDSSLSVPLGSQIAGRTALNLDDLIGALAAGVIGSSAYSRVDVADSLPVYYLSVK